MWKFGAGKFKIVFFKFYILGKCKKKKNSTKISVNSYPVFLYSLIVGKGHI